jgi:hypothetical protein
MNMSENQPEIFVLQKVQKAAGIFIALYSPCPVVSATGISRR